MILEETTAVQSPLSEAIPHRQCSRSVYDGRPLSPADLAALHLAARTGQVEVMFLSERRQIETVLEYVAAGNAAQIGDPAFVSELKAWIRFSEAEAVRAGDGLFSRSTGNPAVPRWLGNLFLGALLTPKSENEKCATQLRSSAGVAVFASRNDHRHWINVGRSYERFALQATALGIRTAFLKSASRSRSPPCAICRLAHAWRSATRSGRAIRPGTGDAALAAPAGGTGPDVIEAESDDSGPWSIHDIPVRLSNVARSLHGHGNHVGLPPERNVTTEFQELIDEFVRVRRDLLGLVEDSHEALEQVHPCNRESAENLLHYIALRSRDLRPLQLRLARAGLSSLGRAESHVLAAVDAVLAVLHRVVGRAWQPDGRLAVVDLEAGQRLLRDHTEALLGTFSPDRGVAIMVTMPSEAADDYTLVDHLIEHGMDCMRINCAHDDEARWARMIVHLRRAEVATGRRCRVLMDLAGPKLRTGPLEPGPAVVKVKPMRDPFGRVIRPARVWLSSREAPRQPPTPADAAIELPRSFVKALAVGDQLTFTDARQAERMMSIVALSPDGGWAETTRTCYLTADVTLRAGRDGEGTVAEACIGAVPPGETAIALATGDQLTLTRELTPGRPAACDRVGHVLTPGTIGCTSPQVFEDAQTGERVWFDDGRIGGVIERTEPDRLHIRITHARARGARLVADKGINLPDSHLHLPAMTEKDRADLNFVGGHADMVALSFVNTVEDVRAIRELLHPLGDRQPAIVLKIETKRGFENLPAMLLEALKAPRCGVMIARGDLAVECGFERLAEVQEEILWLCEAAHVPVIWATQVLESLAKDGLPSRAEITDAAMSHRAECVMLNKGPYVIDAVHVLDDILRRMHGHQAKKRSMLRELRLVSRFRQALESRSPSSPDV